MSRIAKVGRLYLINTRSMLWVPGIILAGSWLLTIAIFWIISSQVPSSASEVGVSGGIQAPLWYSLALGITGMNLLFPFSQTLGITRREFVLGSGLAAAVYSAILSTVLVVGGAIEQLTHGVFGGYFFYIPWIWDDGWFGAWLVFFTSPLLLFLVGFTLAAVYRRFGPLWLTIALLALAAALVALLGVLTFTGSWMRLFLWFQGFGPASTSFAMLITALAVGGLAYMSLRRMVVR